MTTPAGTAPLMAVKPATSANRIVTSLRRGKRANAGWGFVGPGRVTRSSFKPLHAPLQELAPL
jgi:hypothetical protein